MEIDAVLEVEAGDPQIAIDFLVANINLSKSRLKELMNKGGIWRVSKEGQRERIRRAMTDIFVGEQIEIFYDEALFNAPSLQAELIEDLGQYSIWIKPAGMSLEGNDWGDFNSFSRALDYQLKPKRDVYWLQAFDYEATGIMVVAHSRKAAADLTARFNPDGFENAELQYRAEVTGDFNDTGLIEIELDDGLASSTIKKVKYDARPNRSVLDLWPTTGREHQTRVLLRELGFPVIGDESIEDEQDQDMFEALRLKIVETKFECPVKGEIQHVSMVK